MSFSPLLNIDPSMIQQPHQDQSQKDSQNCVADLNTKNENENKSDNKKNQNKTAKNSLSDAFFSFAISPELIVTNKNQQKQQNDPKLKTQKDQETKIVTPILSNQIQGTDKKQRNEEADLSNRVEYVSPELLAQSYDLSQKQKNEEMDIRNPKNGDEENQIIDSLNLELSSDKLLKLAEKGEKYFKYDQADVNEIKAQINPTEKQNQINSIEKQKQVNPIEKQKQINPTEKQKQTNPIEKQKQINPTEKQKQINSNEKQNQIKSNTKQNKVNVNEKQIPTYAIEEQDHINENDKQNKQTFVKKSKSSSNIPQSTKAQGNKSNLEQKLEKSITEREIEEAKQMRFSESMDKINNKFQSKSTNKKSMFYYEYNQEQAIPQKNNVLFSFNGLTALSFQQKNNLLRVTTLKSFSTFSAKIPNRKFTTMCAFNNQLILFGDSIGIHISSISNNGITFPLKYLFSIPNVTKLCVDVLVNTRFFCLASNNLYTFQFFQGKLFYKLIQQNVDYFDFSRNYKLIMSGNKVSCYDRDDYTFLPLFEKTIDHENTKVFIDDEFYYEFKVNENKVYKYRIINDELSYQPIEVINDVKDVFSSEYVIVLSNNKLHINNSIYSSECINDNESLEFATISNGLVCLWYSSFKPRIFYYEKQEPKPYFQLLLNMMEKSKEQIYNYIQNLQKISKKSLEINDLPSNEFIERFGNRLKEKVHNLEAPIKTFEENYCDYKEKCLTIYNENIDESFRFACKKSIEHLLFLCENNRLSTSFSNISTSTLLEVAECFIDNLADSYEKIIPHLLFLLENFDPKNEIIKDRMHKLSDDLLNTTLNLYQIIPFESPLYRDLRRLSHISISYHSDI